MLVYLITLKIIVSRWWRLGWADYSRNFQHQTLFSLLLYRMVGRSVTESVADNNDQVSEIRLGGLRLSFPSKTSTWPDLAKSPLLSLYSYGAKQACNGFLPWKLVQQAWALLNMIFGFSCINTVHTKHNPSYNTRPSTKFYYSLTFHFELQYIIARN